MSPCGNTSSAPTALPPPARRRARQSPPAAPLPSRRRSVRHAAHRAGVRARPPHRLATAPDAPRLLQCTDGWGEKLPWAPKQGRSHAAAHRDVTCCACVGAGFTRRCLAQLLPQTCTLVLQAHCLAHPTRHRAVPTCAARDGGITSKSKVSMLTRARRDATSAWSCCVRTGLSTSLSAARAADAARSSSLLSDSSASVARSCATSSCCAESRARCSIHSEAHAAIS